MTLFVGYYWPKTPVYGYLLLLDGEIGLAARVPRVRRLNKPPAILNLGYAPSYASRIGPGPFTMIRHISAYKVLVTAACTLLPIFARALVSY